MLACQDFTSSFLLFRSCLGGYLITYIDSYRIYFQTHPSLLLYNLAPHIDTHHADRQRGRRSYHTCTYARMTREACSSSFTCFPCFAITKLAYDFDWIFPPFSPTHYVHQPNRPIPPATSLLSLGASMLATCKYQHASILRMKTRESWPPYDQHTCAGRREKEEASFLSFSLYCDISPRPPLPLLPPSARMIVHMKDTLHSFIRTRHT